ncbi:MAG: aminoglycoside phosphotransferase family protein [Lachnospiraceae bacterium]|nr:aminoglycoside phosphotransferase family protein [Lachnospiraceae bacterium]
MTGYEELINNFISEPVNGISELAGGHINASFLVDASEKYVLQRLNKNLYGGHLKELEHNYLQYSSACRESGNYVGKWYCPVWLRSRNGSFFHTDNAGNIWRVYRYMPSDPVPVMSSRDGAFGIGRSLGKLHRILGKCTDIKTIETTKHLHDLEYHYGKFRMQDSSKTERVEELDHIISSKIDSMLHITVPAGKTIHGDAKVSNMIFEDGEAVGFIDLDTIMTGSVFDDIADCLRSCRAYEDGASEAEIITWFNMGYEEGAGIVFSKDEAELALQNVSRNRFVLGIRYYTDYLSSEGYFTEEYPGQSLEKARRLLSMER